MFTPAPSCGGVDQLLDLPRFVVWCEQMRKGKPTKVPYDPITRREAKSDDPTTWASYATAARAAPQIIGQGRGGIGIQLGDLGVGRSLGGIDLDTCRRPDGTLEPWAQQVVTLLETYTEISPSQTGVKLFFLYDTKGLEELRAAMRTAAWGKQWKRGGGEHPPAIELYFGRRYFAVTGDGLPETEPEIAVVSLSVLLKVINEIGPAFVACSNDVKERTGKSRSEAAFRIGAQAKRTGATYEEMVQAIRTHPASADWCREKGDAAGGRELQRIWDKACSAPDEGGIPRGINAIIEEFNSKYLVVNEGGKAVVYLDSYDPDLQRRRYDRLSFEDLTRLHMNRKVAIGVDDKGNPILKTAANVWLHHPGRRQYIDGVAFDPSGSESPAGILNLWRGFAVQPAVGDWSLLKHHILHILCAGDRTRHNYLMAWMARMVQQPSRQGEVAVVLRGGEGTGKGTLAKILLRILGHHGFAISNAKHLVGNFNAHLRDAVFLFADEAFYAGDKQHVGTLKSLITEPYITIEAKFQNAALTANRLHLMLASNEDWVVPAALDARRFFVLEVSDARANDHPYFEAIWSQMNTGGYEAMLLDLQEMDISKFNVRDVPNTPGLQNQRKLSLSVPEAWWQDCLARGYVFQSRLGLEEEFGSWHDQVATELLFGSYLEFAKARRERHPMTREGLGALMRKLGGTAKRLTNFPTGEHVVDEKNPLGHRERIARAIIHPRPAGLWFGDLGSARDAFCAATGLAIEWEPAEIAE